MADKIKHSFENDIIAELREDFADYIDLDTEIAIESNVATASTDYSGGSCISIKTKTGLWVSVGFKMRDAYPDSSEYQNTLDSIWRSVANTWLFDPKADRGEQRQQRFCYCNGSIRGDHSKQFPLVSEKSERELDIRYRLAFGR